MKLTIGMATYDDYEGVYFTIQSLRMYQDLQDVEIVIIDNYGCDWTKDYITNWVKDARYIEYKGVTGTSLPRDLIVKEANTKHILVMDCHVQLTPGTISRLKNYYINNPNTKDLLQGPLLHDDLETISTHFKPAWNDHMYGQWDCDDRGYDTGGEPFEIPMQGLGLYSFNKDAWPGFNPNFRGFGGEEGYIHEKFRLAGGRCLCAPWLRWTHRFGRPYGTGYPLILDDRIRNYFLGQDEVISARHRLNTPVGVWLNNWDIQGTFDHFQLHVDKTKIVEVAKEAIPHWDLSQF